MLSCFLEGSNANRSLLITFDRTEQLFAYRKYKNYLNSFSVLMACDRISLLTWKQKTSDKCVTV